MISRQTREELITWFPKTASTLFTYKTFVTITAGKLVPAGTTDIPVGIIMGSMPVSDTTTNKMMVDTPLDIDEFVMDVGTGTVAASDIGTYVDIQAGNPGQVDITSHVTNQVFVVDIIPSTNQIVGRLHKVMSDF